MLQQCNTLCCNSATTLQHSATRLQHSVSPDQVTLKSLADLHLDTTIFNAHSTALDHLWAGVWPRSVTSIVRCTLACRYGTLHEQESPVGPCVKHRGRSLQCALHPTDAMGSRAHAI